MNSKAKKSLRISLRVLLIIFALIIVLPFTLYIPPVQTLVKNITISYVNKSTGLDISLDRILLKFPLDLSLDKVLVKDSTRDTMVYANHMRLDVKLIPLFHMDINVNHASLEDGIYKMVSEDSSMVLRGKINKFDLVDSKISLKKSEINIFNAIVTGGDVRMAYFKDKVKPTPPDTVKSSGWKIIAKHIKLENIHYSMQMLPYIDNLNTYIGKAELADGNIDTHNCKIKVRSLSLDSIDARYIYPTPEYLAQHPVKPDTIKPNPSDSIPWTIQGDSIRLTNSHAIYAMKGASPASGLDMNYIEASRINIAINDFFNRGMVIRVPINSMEAKERCGIELIKLNGTFSMDSTRMLARDFDIRTVLSKIRFDGALANDFFESTTSPMWLKLNAAIGIGEIEKLYPTFRPMLQKIPQYQPLRTKIDIRGTSRIININQATAELPNYLALKVGGRAFYPLNVKRLSADINFKGELTNADFVKPALLDTAMRKQISLPPLTIDGKLHYAPNDIRGDLSMALKTGEMVFKGNWNGNSKTYAADLNLSEFPIHAIMPLSQFGIIDAVAQVKGRGYDIYKPTTAIEADLKLNKLYYADQLYNDVKAHAKIENEKVDVSMESHNDYCDMDCKLAALLKNKHYAVDLQANVNYIDLQALKLSKTVSKGQGKISGYGEVNLKEQSYDIVLDVNDFNWTLPDNYYFTPKLSANIISDKESIEAHIVDNDFNLDFTSECGVDSFMKKMTKSQKIMMKQIETKSLNIDTLQQSLPKFACDVTVGKNNLLQQYLTSSKIKFEDIKLNIVNDSTIYMKGKAQSVEFGTTKIDTITIYANEKMKKLAYNLHMGNKKGTNDEFASVTVLGGIEGSKLEALLEQKNIKGLTGFKIGVNAILSDTAVNLNFFPKNPIIGYRKWEVNDSNVVAFNYKERHFDADLALRSDSSYLSLKTIHTNMHGQEDVLLNAKGIQIEEWLRLSPFAPPISGVLGADMKLKYDGRNFWGDGVTHLKNLSYDGERVGDFDLTMNLELDPVKNCVILNSNLGVDGRCSITAVGSLNDSTSENPYNLNVEVKKFPLSTASPFLPEGMAQLQGYLSGKMDVTGTPSKPKINGYLQCDSAMVYMPVFGSRLYMPDTKLMVDSSKVLFDHFKIAGSNKKAIDINGYVNLAEIDNPVVDLTARGNNIEFVNSKQSRKSEVFGKGYANLDATINGNINNLDINADVTLLSTTNLTYVMQTDVSTISPQTNGDMVKFVNFTDTAGFDSDSIANAVRTSGMKLDASLTIQQGSRMNVFLSQDGKDRVHIEGDGTLNFSQTPLGDMRLTGRYTINSGYVRYTPPLLSQKLFNFDEGSYVSWTGDLMNPMLNLNAIETLKANVTQEGQDSRLINFLITLSVTNSLSNMAVNFDLNTNDDMTVQNELQSMSPSQRSSQAINLLLYDTYTGPGTTSSSNLSGNPLFSFVNSQLNKWAANTIKGIDLTLGINQYDQTKDGNTSKTTSYSYKISKSLFNDRFKIVVGGSYNPDGDTGEDFAQGLLNDISFVYMLNSSGSMSVKLFRHTGFESILEGEITEMGGAFVMKRKLSSLRNIFNFGRSKKQNKERTDSIYYPTIRGRKEIEEE